MNPTCHNFNMSFTSSDSIPLLVGFNTGIITLQDLIRKDVCKVFNEEVCILFVYLVETFARILWAYMYACIVTLQVFLRLYFRIWWLGRLGFILCRLQSMYVERKIKKNLAFLPRGWYLLRYAASILVRVLWSIREVFRKHYLMESIDLYHYSFVKSGLPNVILRIAKWIEIFITIK